MSKILHAMHFLSHENHRFSCSEIKDFERFLVDGIKIVGFGELSPEGYVDMLYVHKDYLRQKIGQRLLECLIRKAKKLGLNAVVIEASITAKSFFEKQGFEVIKKQVKTLNNVDFVNYRMKRKI